MVILPYLIRTACFIYRIYEYTPAEDWYIRVNA